MSCETQVDSRNSVRLNQCEQIIDEDDSPLPEPDYDFLAFSTPSEIQGNHRTASFHNLDSHEKNINRSSLSQYILGTLIVRVVAARNLKPIKKGGLGQFLWGKNDIHGNNRSMRRGSANPHATLCFGDQLQRTSQTYDTINPVFPRSEQSYFDVTIPVHSLALEEDHVSLSSPRKASKKKASKSCASTKAMPENRTNDLSSALTYLPPPKPLLTINMFHLQADKVQEKYKSQNSENESHHNPEQDIHLGGATINVSSVITGKVPYIDSWIPLHTNENHRNKSKNHYSSSSTSISSTPIPYNGEVRIICEYEPTDPPPRPGDMCRLTGFCNPTHYLYPLTKPSIMFLVNDVLDNDVILSYKSTPENWNCQFRVHRNMIVCAVRHQAAIEKYKDHILNIAGKLIQSPIYDTVTDVVKRRLPKDGLVQVGAEGIVEGLNLLGRWWGGGIETVVGDIVYATNLDGQHSSSIISDCEKVAVGNDGGNAEVENNTFATKRRNSSKQISQNLRIENIPFKPNSPMKSQHLQKSSKHPSSTIVSCPNDFKCPVSLELMMDPYVLVQSGHTYEKKTIYMALAHRPNVDPKTNQPFEGEPQLIPNHTLRGLIHSWLEEHQDTI